MAQCHDQYQFRYRPGPLRSAAGAQCHDTTADEVQETDLELVLDRAVRDWVETIDPGDDCLAHRAVQAAVAAWTAGASVPEACEEARKLVLSRTRHPSQSPTRPSASRTARRTDPSTIPVTLGHEPPAWSS